MLFFRTIIHLLIRNKIYRYITCQRMAGNQLKRFLSMQRYFPPWKQRHNPRTVELLFPITVKVTEPLRFFFCRSLSESITGLSMVLGIVHRFSIWILNISKVQTGGQYGEVRTKKSTYQGKGQICKTVLHGFLLPQRVWPDLYGQTIYPDSRPSAWSCEGAIHGPLPR